MEFAALALLTGVGYAALQMRKTVPGVPATSVAAATLLDNQAMLEDDRPSASGLYESRRLDEVTWDERRRAADLTAQAAMPYGGPNHVVSRNDRMVSGRVHSQLLDMDIPTSKFTHNNMVPFYGGTVKQPGIDEPGAMAYQNKMETFTGAFEFRPFGKKQEIEPVFQPTPQGVVNSSGMLVQNEDRDAWLSRIADPMNRANEVPEGLAPVVVGRSGIRGGETGDTYYDMRRYAMEKDIDALRPLSHPKLSFAGRVSAPPMAIAPPSELDAPVPLVRERSRPALVAEMTSTDQLIRTTGAVVGQVQRADNYADLKVTNRQTTDLHSEYVGAANAASSVALPCQSGRDGITRPVTHRSTLGTFQLGTASAASTGARSGDYGKTSVQIYGNNRDITTVRTHTTNLVSAVKAIVAPIQDAIRVTRREEMTDAPRDFGNVALAQGVPKMTVYDSYDIARTTIKQTTATVAYNLGNVVTQYKPVAYETDAIASMVPRKTVRETTDDVDPVRNLTGVTVHKGTLQDPDMWRPMTTIKEVNAEASHGLGSVGGLQNAAAGAYATSDFNAKTTMRQISDESQGGNPIYGGTAPSAAFPGGQAAPMPDDKPKVTQKEMLSDHDYFGVGVGSMVPTSDAGARAMEIKTSQEEIAVGRAPTQNNVKLVSDVAAIGSVQIVSTGGVAPVERTPTPGLVPAADGSALRPSLGCVEPPRKDDDSIALTQSTDRFSTNISALSTQLGSNPYAPPSFFKG